MVDEKWDDLNRFDQSGFSTPTVFPIERSYKNKFLFLEDTLKAEQRDKIMEDLSYERWLQAEADKHSDKE